MAEREGAIGLGSNLGDKAANICTAVERFCDGYSVRLVALSSLYRTEPWGPVPQDWFLNAAALVRSALEPRELLARAKAVEAELGRMATVRWGPRAIDIDLLWLGELAVDEPDLALPHPGLFQRAFVLAPLAEIAADRVVAGRRIGDAAALVCGAERPI
ncbi:MAG: 2-amino-4-hydroxy-6-hydroxymethyldihydropteridine diphosphokinase [Sphingomonadaceae bacterium]|nr:2-amino-4-hydroxy-6-hydroxymethyldihydropteridine diphosphokinase [Sphingomonadaceae bacterium]